MAELRITNLCPGDKIYVNGINGQDIHETVVPNIAGSNIGLKVEVPPYIGEVVVRVINRAINNVRVTVPIAPNMVNAVRINRIADPVYGDVCPELLELANYIKTRLS